MEPCPAQAAREAKPQLRLAAEQVIAAGDIERQAIGCIRHHDGRHAVAIVGHRIKKRGVSDVIHLLDPEIRNAGARVGQRNAGRKTGTLCLPAERDEAHGALSLFNHDERRLILRAGAFQIDSRLPDDPVRRQQREPDRQEAPRCFRKCLLSGYR